MRNVVQSTMWSNPHFNLHISIITSVWSLAVARAPVDHPTPVAFSLSQLTLSNLDDATLALGSWRAAATL